MGWVAFFSLIGVLVSIPVGFVVGMWACKKTLVKLESNIDKKVEKLKALCKERGIDTEGL